jgi:membrane protease subunit HflK
MNWDWEKLQQRRNRPFGGGGGGSRGGGGEGDGPSFPDFGAELKRFTGFRFPVWWVFVLIGVLWLASGLYIVEPAEIGVVQRFGAYDRQTEPGLHYHLPYPIESVSVPKVTSVRRVEVGFRTIGRTGAQSQYRLVPEESLMLTGDENIIDVQFIVQYIIKDAVHYLFNVFEPDQAVKNAAEAAMREVVGYNQIDSVLTTNKLDIQTNTRDLLQRIMDIYGAGILIQAVQLQDVQPPKEVIEAFKDVASAREDKSRFINESEAYKNDILPKARGQAAVLVNQATAYREQTIRRAKGEADRFLSVLKEYNKAKDVTRSRLYLDAMERVFANPEMDKIVISDEALAKAVPYLPLNTTRRAPAGKKGGE